MPLSSYEGDTFLAYLDISGFKKLMRNEDLAWRALDKFYNAGYKFLRVHNALENKVDGLFVSDCGVLYLKRKNLHMHNLTNDLKTLLRIVKDINKRRRDESYMLKTSISFGRFKYQERKIGRAHV